MSDEKEFQAGERLYLGETKIDGPGLNEHFERYELAKKNIVPTDRVLDAACGTGYGTEMLSRVAQSAVGFEFSEHALQWANTHHKQRNVTYVRGDLNKPLPFEKESFNVVVSFETLEHIENQENVLSEFRRILMPGGKLILSSPDREIITEKAETDNRFHIHELSKTEFVKKVREYFEIEELYGQTKYQELPRLKKAIKRIAKLDVLKLHRKVVGALGLTSAVHETLSPMEYTPPERVSIDEPNQFYVLIAVCRKK